LSYFKYPSAACGGLRGCYVYAGVPPDSNVAPALPLSNTNFLGPGSHGGSEFPDEKGDKAGAKLEKSRSSLKMLQKTGKGGVVTSSFLRLPVLFTRVCKHTSHNMHAEPTYVCDPTAVTVRTLGYFKYPSVACGGLGGCYAGSPRIRM
jgi:hypothetical protein